MSFPKILSLSLCLVLAAGLCQAALLEGFNYADDAAAQADWVVSGNDGGQGGSATVTADSSLQQEGSGCVKFEYSYSGNAYYEMKMTKTLSTPVDLSDVEAFSLKIKGDSSTENLLIWYIRFYSENGFCIRRVEVGGAPSDDWTEFTFDLNNMEGDYWVSSVGGPFGDNADLTRINKIEIAFQQTTDSGLSAGTGVFYIDELQYYQDSDYVGMEVFEGFNYADQSSLDAEWAVTVPSAVPGFALDLSTTDSLAQEGSAAMQMDFTIAEKWRSCTAIKTLAQPVDLSETGSFKLWVKGDSSTAGYSPVMSFVLEDSSVNRLQGRMISAVKRDEWTCYALPFNIDGDESTGSSNAVFWQDDYDGGGECDPTQIVKYGFFLQGNADDPAYSFTVIVDGLERYFEDAPPPPPVLQADDSWKLYE